MAFRCRIVLGIAVLFAGAASGQDARELRPQSVPALLDELANARSPAVRVRAALALATAPQPTHSVSQAGVRVLTIRALTRALQTDRDAGVRAHAAHALGQLYPKAVSSVPALLLALQGDPNAKVRAQAARSLRDVYATPQEVVPGLLLALHDDDPEVLASAARALVESADVQTACPALFAVLRQQGERAYDVVPTVLATNEKAVPLLVAALHDDHPCVRAGAARALGQVNQQEAVQAALRQAVPALGQLLEDPEVVVRRATVSTLYKLWPWLEEVETTVPNLTRALQDEDADVQMLAACTLGDLGPRAASAVPLLVQVVGNDTAPAAQLAAVNALGQMGAAAQTAVPVLIKAVGAANKDLAGAAVDALGMLGAEARPAIPALKVAMRDEVLCKKAAAVLLEIAHETIVP